MPVQYLETVVNTGSFRSENTIDDENEISLMVQSGTAALKFKDGEAGFDVSDLSKSGFFKLPNSEYSKTGGVLVTQEDLENMEFKFGKGIESHEIPDSATIESGFIIWEQPLDNIYESQPVVQLFKEDGSIVLTAAQWVNRGEYQTVTFWIATTETTVTSGSYKFTCFGKTNIAGDSVEIHSNPELTKYDEDAGGVIWTQTLGSKYKNIPIIQVALANGTVTSTEIRFNASDNQVICVVAAEKGQTIPKDAYVMTVYGK